ncbi:hypothetical protein GPALN_012600 [Globodera pallida]|nr:hypothetical protein GPALN_012600 [Globodera pallida]
MLRCSRSEFGAAELMPEAVELGMRVRLRQMRFGQPEEYAQLEQVEVRKFLSSKSVHNWLSEWNLSRTFSAPNRGRNTLNLLDLDCSQRRKQADFCVQCTGEEIDLALGHLPTPAEPAFASPPPAGATGGYSSTLQSYSNPATTAWHFTNNNNTNGSLLNRPRTFHPPSLMNASTNTQTTETTRTSGGTGGRMHVFRRASLLEEYAQKTLRELEEREEGEQKRGRQETEGRRRPWTGGCWASKCCGRRGTDSGDDENDTYSSEAMATNERRTKLSPPSLASSSHSEQSHRTNIVKRFTLTRTSGGGEESSTTPRTAADYAMLSKAYCFNGRGEWTTKGWGRDGGNYDNVPEAWRRRTEEDGMGGDRRNCDRSFFI